MQRTTFKRAKRRVIGVLLDAWAWMRGWRRSPPSPAPSLTVLVCEKSADGRRLTEWRQVQ